MAYLHIPNLLDKLAGELDMALTGAVIRAMVEDVLREAEGEIVAEKSVQRAIGNRAAKLYKSWLNDFTAH